MSTLSISRRFPIDAPPQRVLAYLTTPALLVHCLPGAELTASSEDGKTHEGTVTVKLGAIGVSYRGTAVFEEIDSDARLVRVKAKAREKTGAGSAELMVTMEVAQQRAGVSEVALEASATVSGRLVTFGRGMIDIVSEQLLSEFVSCLSETLAATTAADAPGATNPPAAAANETRSPTPVPASALGILWRALRSWLRRRLRGN